MKALVYEGVKTLVFKDVADPVPANDDVLVKVERVGICGSDMHAYLGHDERRPAPLILGHEAAGTVVSGERIGRRVTVNPLVSCGFCERCVSGRENLCAKRQIISMPPKEGAFAQFITIPTKNLVDVPDHVSFDAACMVEPLACSRHGVTSGLTDFSQDNRNLKALVIGGGAIGFGAALALREFGVNNIHLIETNQIRRKYLEQTSDSVDINFHSTIDATDFDLVFDGVGFKATRQLASRSVKPGGTIVHLGLGDNMDGLDIRRITLQEITFKGIYTYSMQDFRDTAAAVFSGKLGNLDWTSVCPLAEGNQTFRAILSGDVASPKTILTPFS